MRRIGARKVGELPEPVPTLRRQSELAHAGLDRRPVSCGTPLKSEVPKLWRGFTTIVHLRATSPMKPLVIASALCSRPGAALLKSAACSLSPEKPLRVADPSDLRVRDPIVLSSYWIGARLDRNLRAADSQLRRTGRLIGPCWAGAWATNRRESDLDREPTLGCGVSSHRGVVCGCYGVDDG